VLPREGDVWWNCSLESYLSIGSASAPELAEGAFVIPLSAPQQMWNGNCSSGQLTRRGFEQLGALPDVLADGSISRLRSTQILRTQQSVYALLEGLYPHDQRALSSPPVLERRPIELETMLPNQRLCPRERELREALEQVGRRACAVRLSDAAAAARATFAVNESVRLTSLAAGCGERGCEGYGIESTG
jgi:hypothetical protein